MVGFLGNQLPPPPNDPQGNALFQGFRDNGLIIGRDFVFEPRFTEGDDARFPVFARELAQKNVRMILANTPAGVRAAQHLDSLGQAAARSQHDPVLAEPVGVLALEAVRLLDILAGAVRVAQRNSRRARPIRACTSLEA